MNNFSALRDKYSEFLHRCKAIYLKNARKLFFFDQKINYKEKSTNRRDRAVYNGGESKDAKLCLKRLAPSSHAREARARVNGCRQAHARGS